MNALSLLIPRPLGQPGEWTDEEDFHLLVEAIETLLFTSADRPELLDHTVLAAAVAELEARWPEAATELAPHLAAHRRRHAS